MPKTLSIEIETDKEEELYPLLNHVSREITELGYKDDEVDSNSEVDISEGWLNIFEGRFKGKYKWTKQ